MDTKREYLMKQDRELAPVQNISASTEGFGL
jgi:hypothetical protein